MEAYEAALRQQIGNKSLIFLDHVNSTNTYAKQLAAQSVPHGTVIIADHQTAGRGRSGRSFSSPKGLGLYCSVIVTEKLLPDRISLLTVFAAEATRRAILEVCGINAGVKWINDLVYERKKLCGILTELSFSSSGQPDYAIVGIGINCGHKEQDFPEDLRSIAVSLRQILDQEIDRARLAAALLRHLDCGLDALMQDPGPWLDSYRANCITLGCDVLLLQNGEVRQAHADALDNTGALLVTLANGTRERIFSGEVSVRSVCGYV